MITPGLLPLAGDRWTPFARTLLLAGYDLTDATLAAQVRLYKDAPGSPLVNLAQVTSASSEGVRLIYAGEDTIANHISAGRMKTADMLPSETPADTLALTLIGMRINETTMEGLPPAGRPGADVDLQWDIHITPSGALKGKWLYGPFTVRAGVTQ